MKTKVNVNIKKLFAGAILGTFILGQSACLSTDPRDTAETPDQAAEYVMESLSDLDLKTFNAYTDNCVDTYRNWLGVPVKKEYRVFNQLLNTRRINSRRFKNNSQFAERILEHLTWEITDVKEDEDRAEISMSVTNLDMTDVFGEYMIGILEDITEEEGMGLKSIAQIVMKLYTDQDDLISIMDSLEEEEPRTVDLTVSAYKEDGKWKVHLSDEFIDAFTGNIYTEHFSEETEQRIHELERQYESEVEGWADDFESGIEDWTD